LLNEDPEAQQAASAGIFQSTINNFFASSWNLPG